MRAFTQKLEDRKLLAAQLLTVDPVEVADSRPAIDAAGSSSESANSSKEKAGSKKISKNAAKASKPVKDAQIRSINLVGEWDGEAEIDYGFFDVDYDMDLSVYHQTANSIYARIEIDHVVFEGTFYGKINAKNGRFRYTMDEYGEEVEISGQLSKKGKVIGDGKIEAEAWDYYWYWEMEGGFEIDRIA